MITVHSHSYLRLLEVPKDGWLIGERFHPLKKSGAAFFDSSNRLSSGEELPLPNGPISGVARIERHVQSTDNKWLVSPKGLYNKEGSSRLASLADDEGILQ